MVMSVGFNNLFWGQCRTFGDRSHHQSLKGYLGNWPHYLKVVHSKLVFYNILTTSINNTHIKRKNSKTICSSETISSQIFRSAPNSPNTRCHLCNSVGLTSLWHSHRRVHSAGLTFTFFKPANCMSSIPHALPRQRNAAPFSILALGSTSSTNKSMMQWTKFTSMVHVVKFETSCRRDWLFIRDFLIPRN
jgi:hypothetical protein